MIKRVLFLTVGILSLMLAACETKAINNGKKENKMKTIELTKADFLKKIVDYKKNPEVREEPLDAPFMNGLS